MKKQNPAADKKPLLVPDDALLDESALAVRRPSDGAVQDEDAEADAEIDQDGDIAVPDESVIGVVPDEDLADDEVVVPEAIIDPALDPAAMADVKRALVPDVLDDGVVPKAKTQQVPSHWIHEPLRPEDLFDKGSI